MVRYTGSQLWLYKLNLGVFPSGQWGQTVNLLLFSFGGSNPPAPTKRSSIRTGCWVFCFVETFSGLSGRIRTAAALSQKTAQKQPGGLFLAARLATSTRAHQEIQYPNRVLDFLFCRNFFRPGGKKANVKTKVRFLPRPAGCVKLEEKIALMRCILGGNRL